MQPSLFPAGYHENGFTYDIKGSFGISLGTQSEMQLMDSLYAYFAITYRWLKFQDVIMCQFDETVYYPGAYWEVYSNRDFSGVLGSIGVRYEF